MCSPTSVPIRDDAFRDLTDEDEEQDECEQPAEVVTREVEPGAVVDVDLWTLAAPACNRRWDQSSELQHRSQGSGNGTSRHKVFWDCQGNAVRNWNVGILSSMSNFCDWERNLVWKKHRQQLDCFLFTVTISNFIICGIAGGTDQWQLSKTPPSESVDDIQCQTNTQISDKSSTSIKPLLLLGQLHLQDTLNVAFTQKM